MGKSEKTRTSYTKEIGQHRGDLYRRSLNRAKRALAAGFYIESIALTESLLADRLESCLFLITQQPVTQRTASQAARALQAQPTFTNQALLADILDWGTRRNRAVHEFAKINNQDGVTSWHSRLREARQVAEAGLELLTQISRANKALRRSGP